MDIEFVGVVFVEALAKVPMTVVIAFGALLIGAAFGLFVALLRFFNVPFFGHVFRWIVTIFKGTPMVLFITIAYMATAYTFDPVMQVLRLPFSFRDLNKVWIGVGALAFLSTIIFSEAFRGAMASVGSEQYDAAYSVGETKIQALARIVLPQALVISLPMVCNITIGTIKGVSLLSLISVVEIFGAAKNAAGRTYQYLEAYVAAALIYWVLCIIVEQVFGLVERRLGRRTREV